VTTFFDGISVSDNIFILPVLDRFLIYAPLHNLAALVDRTAARRLREGLFEGKNVGQGHLGEIADILQGSTGLPPQPKQGALSPAFLGLLPTRSCNFACRYCGFLEPGEANKVMDMELARDAVDWYMALVGASDQRCAEVHFFGGEPFCAQEVLDLTVHLVRIRAEEIGCMVRFEVATNGAFSEARCRWAADNLDTIVLSLDGPADIQNWHRPYRDGRGSFETVARNAAILSEGAGDLFFRSCVTAQTVDRMPAIAAWFCQSYRPQGVCFEPVQPADRFEAEELEPPDPWTFARNFIRAAEILEDHGVEPVYAAADIQSRQVSFCPVGQDVVIVSPDGAINACYLLPQDWEAKSLDLCLGQIEGGGSIELDPERVASVRRLNVWNKPFCSRCFCKWHCAGGCHVNHGLPASGDYDRLCLQTRIIALRNILKALGRQDLVHELLEEAEALERVAWQVSDTLFDLEERL
jgi:uncharacterized protein